MRNSVSHYKTPDFCCNCWCWGSHWPLGCNFSFMCGRLWAPRNLHLQAAGGGGISAHRRTLGWKTFLLTGRWDTVHLAAMVIMGWAVLLSVLFREAFCGWFCPIGTTAIAAMDQVVQQNAANAEESASSAEIMNHRAGEIRGTIRGLVTLVRGANLRPING